MSPAPRFFGSSALLGALFSLFLSTAYFASAADAEPLKKRPSDWRDQHTLIDGWQFVRGDLGGVWETLRSDDRALDLPVWKHVSLPHSFNARDAVDPDTPYYQGPGWYRTQLEINNPHPQGHTLLHLEGAAQKIRNLDR